MSTGQVTTVRTLQAGDRIRFHSRWDTRVWEVDSVKTLPAGDMELWVSRAKGEHGEVAYAIYTMLADARVFRTATNKEAL